MKNGLIGLLMFVLMIASSDSGYPDGIHFSDTDTHLYEPDQKAVIIWDGQTEIMILASAVKSNDIANFAWVVPVRSFVKPEVTKGDVAMFNKLVKYFEIPKENEFSNPNIEGRAQKGSAGIQILETKSIDIFDVTILKATSSEELITWLNQNGYKTPSDAKSIFDQYTSNESYFVANKINLRNRYTKEIDAINRIFNDVDKAHKTLCENTSQAFQKAGLKPWVGTDLHDYVVQCAKEEFVTKGLQPEFSIDLGAGLTCHAQYSIVSEYLTYNPPYINLGFAWDVVISKNQEKIISGILGQAVFATIGTGYPSEPYKFSKEDLHKLDPQDRVIVADFSRKRGRAYQVFRAKAGKREAVIKDLVASLSKAGQDLGKINDYKTFYSQVDNTTSIIRGCQYLIDANTTEWLLKLLNVPYDKDLDFAWDRLQPWVDGLGKENFQSLLTTLNDLRLGMATPLKFEFKPLKPWYPLLISSLSKGATHIELYVFGKDPVCDANSIMGSSAVKTTSPSLKEDLKKYLTLDELQYVTRLTFQGECAALTKDAVLIPTNPPPKFINNYKPDKPFGIKNR